MDLYSILQDYRLFPRRSDFCHGVGFGAGGDGDVRLHGFVIGMAGEFHHDLGRDADGEHKAGYHIALRELIGLHTEANSVYWTSTERIHNNGHCDYAWFHSFNYHGSFTYDFKIRGGNDNNYVRSALAF